jgi:fibrillarin-like pre-rRNA processing protein
MKKTRYEGVYALGREIATINFDRGNAVYGEKLVKEGKEEYRMWNPRRSKLASAIMKQVRNIFIKKGDRVLYLGAASGTTASHVSDIVGEKGYVFSLDISPRVVRDLVFVAERRSNMFPILADARNLDYYKNILPECDVVYQDIASPQQTDILIKNCDAFLKNGGHALFAVKSRSIDVTADPKKIFDSVEKQLRKYFEVIDKKRLEPFDKDHMFFVLEKKRILNK